MPLRLLPVLVYLLVLVFPYLAKAQKDTTTKPDIRILGISLDTMLSPGLPRVDTSYIKTYTTDLHMHLLLEDTDYALRFIGDDRRLIYKPNVASSIGIGLSYSWMSFDLTLPTPKAKNEAAQKGTTKRINLGFSYSGRKVWFDTNYQQYKGLFLSNPDALAQDWFQQNTNYPMRPDITSKTFYARTYYSFNNERFSLPATMFNQEQQKKNAGSFLLGGTFVYAQLTGDSSLVPVKVQSYFPVKANLVRHRSATYSANVGYAYTFVFKKYFFASALLRPGLAFRVSSGLMAGREAVELPNEFGLQGDGRATLGFNTDRYYGGVTGSLLLSSGSLMANNRQRSYYSEVQVLVGRRFGYKARGLFAKIPGF